MRLDEERRARFVRAGYLFFPSLFAPEELRTRTDAVPLVSSTEPVDYRKLAA
jgi:ectoine hydroxylase